MSKFNWQQPYVNIFKHFTIASDKNAIKHGDITTQTDSQIKSSIYKISGTNSTSNYIQLPKLSGQSLNLTGRYIYFLIKPIPNKSFSFHIDITTNEKTLLRISFSNLYKEFKSTSTWLQFPYFINSPKGSIYEKIEQVSKDSTGLAPPITKWTIFCIDLIDLVQSYSNRNFNSVRGLKICSNLLIKNVITSDILYEPGLNCSEARLRNLSPFPRDLSYPCEKYTDWHQFYDFIVFSKDSIQKFSENKNTQNKIITPYIEPHSISVNLPKKTLVTSLPIVGVQTQEPDFVSTDDAERQNEKDIHVYPFKSGHELVSSSSSSLSSLENLDLKNPNRLEPDPILRLNKIIGFGSRSGSSISSAVNLLKWTNDSNFLIYACQSIVIALNLDDKNQYCYVGHSDRVSCVALSPDNSLIASGQTGPYSLVRLWDFQTRKCLSIFRHHDHSLNLLEFSSCGNFLCGVGKDKQGKSMLVLWDIKQCRKNTVKLIAKAHSDVSINRLIFVHYDSSRLITCGKDNVRFWRLKNDTLRSCAVNLTPYLTDELEFTDICMNSRLGNNDNLVYSCTRNGKIFVFNIAKMEIEKVKIIEPVVRKTGILNRHKNSPCLKLNSISISDEYCVTGSDDGCVRLWPLDFSQVSLEAEHDSPITVVKFSSDCSKIASGTLNGNLGVLNVDKKDYNTLIRGHVDIICDVSLDPTGKFLATCSADLTLRVWSTDNCKQLYDFTSANEKPKCLNFMPSNTFNKSSIFACGFSSGKIRVFDLTEAKLINEIKSPHLKESAEITDLKYSNEGKRLIAGDSLKYICLYDPDRDYTLLRILPKTIVSQGCLSISPDQKFLSVIGPDNFMISIFDSSSLNEVMRISIASSSNEFVDNCDESVYYGQETAVRLTYSTYELNQLICVTSSNRLLKFDTKTGRLISSLPKIHRALTDCLTVSNDGRFLITSGDNAIKVWDYNFRFDKNYQAFIGHSSTVNRVIMSSDNKTLISVGDSIVFWDFMAYFCVNDSRKSSKKIPIPEGRDPEIEIRQIQKLNLKSSSLSDRESFSDMSLEISFEEPKEPPIPTNIEIETILTNEIEDTLLRDDLNEDITILDESIIEKPKFKNYTNLPNFLNEKQENFKSNSTGSLNMISDGKIIELETEKFDRFITELKPMNSKHLMTRKKQSLIAKKRFSAPENKCGIRLKSAIGYNGKYSSDNLIWNSTYEFFASSIGSTLCVEDLKTGQQKILSSHHEDITCIALRTDMTQMASVSSYSLNISISNEQYNTPKCQIVIWDCDKLEKINNLFHQNASNITCFKYSTDDRFLISVSDYMCPSLLIWSTYDYNPMILIDTLNYVINDLVWNPYKCNEFVMCGTNKCLLKCEIDEKGYKSGAINFNEFDIPLAILEINDKFDFTGLTFGSGEWLFVANNYGLVTVWNLKSSSCFLNWKADSNEIDYLVNYKHKLITGSSKGNLKLWNIGNLDDIKSCDKKERRERFIIENEINLNGAIKSCNFDSSLDIGILGTNKNTLWYVNWKEESSIRLVSSHSSKINQLLSLDDNYLSSVSDDGSLNIWSVTDRERVVQFEVKTPALCQSIIKYDPKIFKNSKISNKSKLILVGYSDGSIRLYDIDKKNILNKLKPFNQSVTYMNHCEGTSNVLVGSIEGLIAVVDLNEGITTRILEDHKGAPITSLDSFYVDENKSTYWLATSRDRKVSIWNTKWSEDLFKMIHWLSFPAPFVNQEKESLKYWLKYSPSLAYFEPKTKQKSQIDTFVYVGYGLNKQIVFFNFLKKEIIRTMDLSEWSECMAISPRKNLLAFGTKTRLLQIKDYCQGTFQDFSQHSDTISSVCFSSDGKKLFSCSFNEIFIWDVNV
ncbi:unnamed protein product [Brachionus calyciflorus]|uniref:Uncharacterized protein n=1 Tax=Brachionus calyciflorus TaxID=104777 RepID=A0A814EDZ0_9BILA|nr:unnamed protein product [Brachionus calyciflorus]